MQCEINITHKHYWLRPANHEVATPLSISHFIVYCTQNGTIIHKMNMMLYLKT